MKKICISAALLFIMITTSGQGFEGATILPSFQKFLDTHELASIEGRTITVAEYSSGKIKGRELSPGEAGKLALILIQVPSELELSYTNIPNLILTTEGTIWLGNSKKQGWRIGFIPNNNTYWEYGAKVFSLN